MGAACLNAGKASVLAYCECVMLMPISQMFHHKEITFCYVHGIHAGNNILRFRTGLQIADNSMVNIHIRCLTCEDNLSSNPHPKRMWLQSVALLGMEIPVKMQGLAPEARSLATSGRALCITKTLSNE